MLLQVWIVGLTYDKYMCVYIYQSKYIICRNKRSVKRF